MSSGRVKQFPAPLEKVVDFGPAIRYRVTGSQTPSKDSAWKMIVKQIIDKCT